jgi:hypothetical protein
MAVLVAVKAWMAAQPDKVLRGKVLMAVAHLATAAAVAAQVDLGALVGPTAARAGPD